MTITEVDERTTALYRHITRAIRSQERARSWDAAGDTRRADAFRKEAKGELKLATDAAAELLAELRGMVAEVTGQ